MAKRMICPYCNQDWVWRVALKSAPSHRFSMCFECDSVWPENENISDVTGTNFEKLMATLSMPDDWDNVVKLTIQGD